MALEIKWGRSPNWYGRFIREGKRMNLNLGVRIEGTPPASQRLKDRGDTAFERSRIKAEVQLQKAIEEFSKQHAEESLLRRIYEAKTGGTVGSIGLDEIFDRFNALPRKKPVSASWASQNRRRFQKFVDFVRKRSPTASNIADVNTETAEAFMAAEFERGVSAKTYNDTLIFLRGVFERLKRRAGLLDNPFEEIPLREREEIGRLPFSFEELTRILKVLERVEHEFIRPVVIVGICTAMRRGDCCRLRWREIDLREKFIEVTTSKTGSKVTIPLFPLLADELSRIIPRTGEFVFPNQRTMYEVNPDGITLRVKHVLAEAGFSEEVDAKPGDHLGPISVKRANGLRAASVRGFHSFRVTWATNALLAGVPVELVKKVTGHQTVSVLLQHYFKPGREELRRTLQEKMPRMFSLGSGTGERPVAKSSQSEISELLRSMTTDNWRDIRDGLLLQFEQGAA